MIMKTMKFKLPKPYKKMSPLEKKIYYVAYHKGFCEGLSNINSQIDELIEKHIFISKKALELKK